MLLRDFASGRNFEGEIGGRGFTRLELHDKTTESELVRSGAVDLPFKCSMT